MSAAKDETRLTEDDIYDEHQRAVKPLNHWAYLAGVVGGGLLVMLAFITVLGAVG